MPPVSTAASLQSDDEDLEDALVIGAAAAVALAIAIGAVVLALRLRRRSRPRRERGRGGRKLRPRSSVRRPRRGQYERARTVEV